MDRMPRLLGRFLPPTTCLLAAGCSVPAGPVAPPQWAGRPEWNVRILGSYGMGETEHETDGSALDDMGDANYWSGRLDFNSQGSRFGLAAEGYEADEDLFGANGTPGTTTYFDGLLYAGGDPVDSERVSLPLWIGLSFSQLELEFNNVPVSSTWWMLGSRFGLDPEVYAVAGDDFDLAFFGSASGTIGIVGIDVEAGTASQTFSSIGLQYGLQGGIRARFGPVLAAISYLRRWTQVDESEPKGGAVVREINDAFDGFVATVGLQF